MQTEDSLSSYTFLHRVLTLYEVYYIYVRVNFINTYVLMINK